MIIKTNFISMIKIDIVDSISKQHYIYLEFQQAPTLRRIDVYNVAQTSKSKAIIKIFKN